MFAKWKWTWLSCVSFIYKVSHPFYFSIPWCALNYLLGIDWDVIFSLFQNLCFFCLGQHFSHGFFFFFLTVIVAIIAVHIVVSIFGSFIVQKTCFSSPEGLYFRVFLCRRTLLFCPLEFMLSLDSKLSVELMWDISDQKSFGLTHSCHALFPLQDPS